MASLRIEYKGKEHIDMSFIDLADVEVKGDKSWSFKLLNRPDERGNSYDVKQIAFKTNMAADLYKIAYPQEIAQGGSGAVNLTIFTEKLFNDKSRDIYDQNEQHHILQMQFDYMKIRTFR